MKHEGRSLKTAVDSPGISATQQASLILLWMTHSNSSLFIFLDVALLLRISNAVKGLLHLVKSTLTYALMYQCIVDLKR